MTNVQKAFAQIILVIGIQIVDDVYDSEFAFSAREREALVDPVPHPSNPANESIAAPDFLQVHPTEN